MSIRSTQIFWGCILAVTCFLAPVEAKPSSFAKRHPARAEVIRRDVHQINRVNKALTNKKLTYQQGSKIKAQDRAIRKQEQLMSKLNGGVITPAEHKALNQEENRVNREIKQDERKDASLHP